MHVIGFERLVMTSTGVENIRDVIPFPRVPGHAEFWFIFVYGYDFDLTKIQDYQFMIVYYF